MHRFRMTIRAGLFWYDVTENIRLFLSQHHDTRHNAEEFHVKFPRGRLAYCPRDASFFPLQACLVPLQACHNFETRM